ncbi:hypothetical protein [Rhizobium sp. 12,4]|uniref:hypothetical protein n=1 Tax=Rhizobium sp. 12,4 TaxID=3405135 RepID=UPI003D329705
MSVSVRQQEMMRHALGLTRGNVEYRNHFVASDGSQDCQQWQELVSLGLATSAEFGGAPNSTIFRVTDAGRRVAASKAVA